MIRYYDAGDSRYNTISQGNFEALNRSAFTTTSLPNVRGGFRGGEVAKRYGGSRAQQWRVGQGRS